MTHYIGEFDCTVDAKSRMMLPAGLLKQFPKRLKERFIVNRSVFQKCLVLHPIDAWQETVNDLMKLNRFNKKNDDFIRQYTNGGVSVDIDSNNRLLIPKRLLDYARIKSDVVLTASLNKIEIWSSKHYGSVMKNYEPDAFALLAEEVMGSMGNKQSKDVS